MKKTTFDHATACNILTEIISEFTQEQKDNLKHNLDNNIRILCATEAYLFCDENAGCLLTLANTRNIPRDRNSMSMFTEIVTKISPIYAAIIKKHGMRYYFATQSLDASTFRNYLLTLVS